MLTGFEIIRDETTGGNGDNNNDTDKSDQTKAERTTPNVKKRHGGRHKGKDHLKNGVKTSSSSVGYVADGAGGGLNGSEADSEGNFEFHIVSLDNKQWHFEAGSAEERDEWVTAIEQQILNSLQVKCIHQSGTLYQFLDVLFLCPPYIACSCRSMSLKSQTKSAKS